MHSVFFCLKFLWKHCQAKWTCRDNNKYIFRPTHSSTLARYVDTVNGCVYYNIHEKTHTLQTRNRRYRADDGLHSGCFFRCCCYCCCCFVYVVGNLKSQIQTFCQHIQEPREWDRFCVCQTEFQAVTCKSAFQIRSNGTNSMTPTIQPKINAAKFTAICCVCRETANISAASMECWLRFLRSCSVSFSIFFLASFFAFFLSSLPFLCLFNKILSVLLSHFRHCNATETSSFAYSTDEFEI